MAWAPPSTWTISAGGGGEPVGQQRHAARAAGPGSVMFQPSGARSPHSPSNRSKPGMLLAAIVRSGPADTRFTRMPLPPRSRARYRAARLQAGLGHAHPVVAGPGDAGVEIEADDRAAAGHHRQRRHGQGLQRERRDLDRGRHVLPGGVEEVAAHGFLRRERDRVHHPVQPVDVRRRAVRPASRDGPESVTSSSSTGGGSGSRLAIRSTRLSRPYPVSTTVAPSCCATLATWNAIEESVSTPVTRMRLPARIPMAVSVPCRGRRPPG